MKLSFSTLGCPAWSWQEILDRAKEYGYDGIEIRGIEKVMNSYELPPFLPENAEGAKAELRARGLTLCALGTSVMFHDPEKKEAALKEGLEGIEVCARMGIPYMRVFGDQVDPENPEENIRRAAEGLAVLCAAAEKQNVTVLLEIHGTFNTIETLQSLLKKAPAKAFGILWDIQHSDRTYGDDYLPFYNVIAPYIRHVHVKDYHRPEDLCLVGEGDIPLKQIVHRLRADGYDGFYSLEWEKRWHPELQEPEVAFSSYAKWMRENI